MGKPYSQDLRERVIAPVDLERASVGRLPVAISWAKLERARRRLSLGHLITRGGNALPTPISWLVRPTVSRVDYYSSISGPPRLGVVRLTVSYSVTRTTPGTGSSTTSMIVSSMTGTLNRSGLIGGSNT